MKTRPAILTFEHNDYLRSWIPTVTSFDSGAYARLNIGDVEETAGSTKVFLDINAESAATDLLTLS